MRDIQHLTQEINQYINGIQYGAPIELYEPIIYTLEKGGKRIRSLLVLLSHGLFNSDIDRALPLAAAIEIFHNFTLVHDDIMDEAPIRRGRSSAYIKYGQDRAILSGDMMLIKSYQLLEDLEPVALLLKEFNKVGQEVCEGQQMDMLFEQRLDVQVDEYLEMIRLKTSVLLASAMKMGAIAGGADERASAHLYQIGLNLGLAFQIQDDYLDCFGNASNFGKQIGGDILQGKKTILFLLLRDQLAGEEREKFELLYHSDSEDKIEKVMQLFRSNGIDRKVLQLKNEYEQKAFEHLNQLQGVNAIFLEQLHSIAKSLSVRSI